MEIFSNFQGVSLTAGIISSFYVNDTYFIDQIADSTSRPLMIAFLAYASYGTVTTLVAFIGLNTKPALKLVSSNFVFLNVE